MVGGCDDGGEGGGWGCQEDKERGGLRRRRDLIVGRRDREREGEALLGLDFCGWSDWSPVLAVEAAALSASVQSSANYALDLLLSISHLLSSIQLSFLSQ